PADRTVVEHLPALSPRLHPTAGRREQPDRARRAPHARGGDSRERSRRGGARAVRPHPPYPVAARAPSRGLLQPVEPLIESNPSKKEQKWQSQPSTPPP